MARKVISSLLILSTLAASFALPYHAGSYYPQTYGYSSPLYAGSAAYGYSHPIDGAYWTGYGSQHPLQNAYGSPHYGYQQADVYGYGVYSSNGYPYFNPGYWTGHHGNMYNGYPAQHLVPVQGHGLGHYPVAPMHYPPHPLYPPRRGLLNGKVTKGVVGALLVGTVAGLVARGK